jgi:hypothetical protein
MSPVLRASISQHTSPSSQWTNLERPRALALLQLLRTLALLELLFLREMTLAVRDDLAHVGNIVLFVLQLMMHIPNWDNGVPRYTCQHPWRGCAAGCRQCCDHCIYAHISTCVIHNGLRMLLHLSWPTVSPDSFPHCHPAPVEDSVFSHFSSSSGVIFTYSATYASAYIIQYM